MRDEHTLDIQSDIHESPMETTKNTANYRSGGGAKESPSANRRSPSEAGDGSETTGTPRLYHTLTACTRCRSRKTRCDAGLPKCGPCERSGTHCEFFDSAKQKTIPRSYVVHLQKKVRVLEEEVARREASLAESEAPNNEELVRGIGAVKFGDYEHYKEPRYVGSSSGVTVTRLVLESAKRDLKPGEFKDMTYQHRKNAIHASPEPNHGYSSLNSPQLLEAKLPPRQLGETLVSFFCKKALYMLPVLHEPTFMKEVADVYEGSTDPFKNFKLRMVLAISLQKYSKKYAAVADSYFLAGLRHLEAILEPMDHLTLQCLLIMVQYSLVTPTRIAAYHVVGLCVRLCIQLGYHQERTIMLSEQPLDPITKDMRRRWFWTLASMEYGLSHVLGRPSAFATSDAYVDVKFYEPVDDIYITAGGILPAPPSGKKLISMHFFEMRRLQAEIRRTLYQNPTETPKTDRDPWFIQMYDKCTKWKGSCPADDEGSGLSETWFHHRHNNILIFMYRPSPQIPQPSLDATMMCYNCAVENIQLEKKMFDAQAVELTWVFLHQIYTVTLTIIWTLYNPEIRKMHSKHEVEGHIRSQIQLLISLAELWPGAEAAADLFARLAGAVLRNYDTDLRKSPPLAHSPQTSVHAHSPQTSVHAHSPQTSVHGPSATVHTPVSVATPPSQQYYSDNHSPHSHHSPHSFSDGSRSVSDTPSPHAAAGMTSFVRAVYESNTLDTPLTGAFSNSSPPAVSPVPSYRDFQGVMFDSNFMNTMFSSVEVPNPGIPGWLQTWDPSISPTAAAPPTDNGAGVPMTSMDFSSSIAAPALDYLGQTAGEILNQQAQHDELMRILENEAMHEFDFSNGEGQQEQRPWGYGGESLF